MSISGEVGGCQVAKLPTTPNLPASLIAESGTVVYIRSL
jgi:hypothetical protein